MTEEPTQRIQRPGGRAGYDGDAATTALPGPLNLAGSSDAGEAADSSTTDVLSLDELLGPPIPAAPEPEVTPGSSTAPTWTAMPVVAVRSEPMTAATSAPAPASPASGRSAAHPALGDRLRTDAAAAWDGALRRTSAWLHRDDNMLMLLTALVAVVLILAVAAFAR